MDLKTLKQLFKLCRTHGVTDFSNGDLVLKFGELPPERTVGCMHSDDEVDDPYKDFPAGDLTPSQLAFYSAGGNPSDDPENQ